VDALEGPRREAGLRMLHEIESLLRPADETPL
jgi:hypothetical protein